MSAEKKIIVVVGATGLQGGSVVDAFLQVPEQYHVRALTRNVDSAKAKMLAQKTEVVSGDLKDNDSLSRAFQDAHIIYAMTDFWADMDFDVEYAQGKALADIADALPCLEHFIWSALPDAKTISNGKYPHVYHWQSKAAVTDYIRESKPELWKKTTTVLFPNYMENCLTNPSAYLPMKQADGTYVRSFPLEADTCLPNACIADTGKLVYHVIQNRSKYASSVIAFYSEAISEGTKLEALGKYYNIPVRYNKISEQEFRNQLEKNMPAITALDFTEQLMIFEAFGNIYARPEFIQANQIEGLKLKTWDDFLQEADLGAHLNSA
ncbi:hypothetical protein B5807_01292 [Epicoccum nigrum]|uniref:NmrA-like domain-containing protein n=1 Tax=Epicoccum nigrum TaxID=105696 RepID=A0A1Y2MF06_EPING|nr:hypothetical protein B5807_01292 [Epicoccum nigrum]